MKIVLNTNVRFLMRRLRRRYLGLCGTDRCDNIHIDILQVCDPLGGILNEANANMTIFDINSRLAEDGNLYKMRDILQIMDGAFYDMTVINDNLLKLPTCYYTRGYIYNLDGICEQCPLGHFSNRDTYQCELCPKDTYSSPRVDDSCILCPDGQTTPGSGSILQTDCVFSVKKKDLVIIIVCASVGGFIIIVITTIIIVVCVKRRSSSKRGGNSSVGSGSQAIKPSQSRHKPTQRATSNLYNDPHKFAPPGFHQPHSRLEPGSRQTQSRLAPPQKMSSVYYIPSSTHKWDNESVHEYNRPRIFKNLKGANKEYIIPVDYQMSPTDPEPTYEEID